MDKTTIKFLRQRDYKYMKEMGRGGLGRTILIHDEIIDEFFVCKKYLPLDEGNTHIYFRNFVDEIKLLHLIYHKNIVRVFNYYLYPEKSTGYILMEYIKGENIEEFIQSNPLIINKLFIQVIEAFAHLEENQIMHRDVRPENILVSEDGIIKVIDFGFGKKIEFGSDDFEKSITLNWRYSVPSEFKESVYDFKSEIFFIGKLFEEMIERNKIDIFVYTDILKKMILVDYEKRITSFFEISKEILNLNFYTINFTIFEKNKYLAFATNLSALFASIFSEAKYQRDIGVIIVKLEEVYKSSALENFIQNIPAIAQCFINGGFRFHRNAKFSVGVLRDFIIFLKSLPLEKQMIVISNIWQRLDNIKRDKFDPDDLPF